MVTLALSLPDWRAGPGEEEDEAPRRAVLHPDLPYHSGPEEDAAHRPQHVHPRGPGAHLTGQRKIQPCE